MNEFLDPEYETSIDAAMDIDAAEAYPQLGDADLQLTECHERVIQLRTTLNQEKRRLIYLAKLAARE